MKKTFGKIAKTATCFILSAFMVLGLMPTNINVTTVFAQDAQGFTIKVNTVDSSIANDIHVTYGDDMDFALEGEHYEEGRGDLKFLRLSYPNPDPSSAQWEEIKQTPTPTTWPVGSYYLGYQYYIDDNNSWDNGNGDFKVTVDKDTASAPANLDWLGGSIAKWDAVTETTHEREVEIASYTVSLYKVGTAAAISTQSTSSTSYDFTSVLNGQTEGDYYFKVKAVVSETTSFNDSAEATSGNTHKVKVTLVKGLGIASVDPSSAFYLLSGDEAAAISATPTIGGSWNFWKWESSDSGVTIAGSSDASTTVSIPKAYTGSNVVTVTAYGKDIVAPTISSFAKKAGSQTQLTGSAVDNETGIAAYAFSTATAAGDVGEGEWVEVSKAAGETLVADHTLTAKGNYYFYVEDNHGNITKSSSDILVSKIIYNNYTLDSNYLIGTGDTVTLPASPTKSGWTFEGWYDTATFDNKITQVTNPATASDVNVYAKWTRQQVSFKTQPQSYSATYDGAEHNLTVAVNNASGTITYQWYKKGTGTDIAIEDATSSTYKVKNYADSGQYYVIVSIEDDEGEVVTGTSDTATVAIAKAELTVTAGSETINYKDDAPTYTATITGYKGADTESVVTKGTITSSYKKGDKADEYAIVPAGYSADNYSFNYVNGKLTVKPLDVNAAGSEVEIAFVDPSAHYYYDGTAKVPAITVKDGDDTIATSNYDVSYAPDNIHAGTVTLTVTFKQSYKGSLQLSFVIEKRTETPTVVISDWTYDGTAHAPSISGYGGTATPVYYYKAEGASEYTTTAPIKASKYSVYAVIPATSDDNGYTTAAVNFEIKKVNITLTAPTDLSYNFNGGAHEISQAYTVTGSFVGTDGLKTTTNVYAKDSTQANVGKYVTLAGNYTTHVSYELTATTVASNYNITTVPGTCVVNKATLPVPTDIKWKATSAGTASWLAVVADNVTVKYDVVLYKQGQTEPVATITNVEDTEYNFVSAIQNDCATAGAAGGYYFKVKAKAAAGTSAANYNNSDYTAASAQINTIAVQLINAGGIGALKLGGVDVTSGQTVYLFSGQTVAISAQAATGYTLSSTVWTTDSTLISIETATISDTNIIINTLGTPGTTVQKIYAHADDNPPKVTGFTGTTNATRTQVTLNLKATDELGISAYAIKKDSQTTPTAAEWTAWAGGDLDVDHIVTEPGTYYAFVKDTNGNIVESEVHIVIYKIEFDGGEGSEGTMNPILKIQNVSEKLPANAFTKEGHSWVGWVGDNTGAYGDEFDYDANSSDVLRAKWDVHVYTYTVNYYLEDLATGYPSSPSSTTTFEATHGTVVSTTTESIQLSDLKGMSVDPDHASSITVKQNGLVLNVYYKLNEHKITYSYKDTEGATQTIVENYKYGQAVTEHAKPAAVEGWIFKGWDFGGAGSLPETMPDYDITVTGEYISKSTYYDIVYFREELDGTYSEINTTSTATVNAIHGDPLTGDIYSAGSLSACTYKGVKITYGAKGSTTPGEGYIQATDTGVVDAANHTYINYYYTRNSYNITLKVYRRDSNNDLVLLYTHAFESQKFGTSLGDLSNYTNYGYSEIPDDPGSGWGDYYEDPNVHGYKIQDQASWSCGDAPTTQPSTNITVSRYIVEQQPSFFVETYFMKADGTYPTTPESKNLYSMNPGGTKLKYGETVSIGTGAGVTIDYTSDIFKKNFKYGNYLNYYSYDTAKNATDGVLSGVVEYAENESGYLVLKIYFERQLKPLTINYYYDNGDGKTVHFYTAKWTDARWGNNRNSEVLALFDGSATPNWVNGVAPSQYGSVAGQEAYATFDFRNNGYMVKYQSSALESEAALVDILTKTQYIYEDGSTVSVVYYKIEPPVLKYIDVMWKYYNLNQLRDFRENVAHDVAPGQADLTLNEPLTIENAGITYKVRIVSEPYVYSDSVFTSATNHPTYPALNILLGTWQNGTTLKPGFSKVNIDGKIYHTSTDGSTNYIYVFQNKIYSGQTVGFSYPSDLGVAEISGKATLYKNTYSTKGTEKYDEYAKFTAYYRNSFNATLQKDVNNYTYVMYISYQTTKRVYHSINGLRCTGHLVLASGVAEGEDLICEDTSWTNAPQGYTPVWFLDANLTNPVVATSKISMGGTDQFLYGKFALAILDCEDWAFYRVLRDTTVTSGTKYKDGAYLTEAQIAELVEDEDPKLVAEVTDSVDVYVNDSLGIPRQYTITTTKYVLDGQLVAVKRSHPTIAFSSTSMNWSAKKVSDGTTITFSDEDFNSFYASTGGYSFSSTDSRNVVATTIGGTSTVSGTTESYLKKYYTYTYPTFTLNNNYTDELNTPEKSQPHYGKNVTINTPSEVGYRFTGWKFTKDSGTGQGQVWTDAPTWSTGQSSVSFDMPSFSVTATAQWVDAEVDTVITNYLETVTHDYDSTVTEGLEGGQTVTVSYGGSTYSGTLYDNGVLTVTDAEDHTSYFRNAKLEEGVYSVVLSDLRAIRWTTQKLNHSTSKANADALTTIPHFTYSYTVRKTTDEVVRAEGTQDISYGNGVSVDLYYAREKGLVVRTAAFIMTGSNRGNGGGTIVGDGSYTYYKEISTVITPGRGYSMTAASTITSAGWYKASDVLKDYDPASSQALKDYELKDDLTGLTPYCANSETYTFNVEESVDLIALLMPTLPEIPTTTISGKTEYVYDYVDHHENTINVSYTMPEGSDGTTIVNNYKWYKKEIVDDEPVWVEIPDYHSSTYNIPQGLDVGSYTYRCEVCVMRIDNANTDSTFTDEFTITVTKATWAPEYQNITIAPYSGIYDGEQHGMTLVVLKPTDASKYEIYYRVGTPINTYSECTDPEAETKGITTINPTKKDVGTYTVYYYIHSNDGNYYDAKGNSTITITPATVTLKATNIPYTRVYDGTADVIFSEIIQGSTEQYTVDGLFGLDSLTVSGSAIYNSSHVDSAATVTLSDMTSDNDNYVFADDYIYTIPGAITPFIVNGALSQTTKTYNGEEQYPVFTIASGQSIPDPNLAVEVSGATEAGSYEVSLSVKPTSLTTGRVSDYAINETTGDLFEINPIEITVTPKARTVEYDGTTYTLNDYTVTGTLVSGHSVKAIEMANEYTNAGTYPGIAISKAHIRNEADVDFTDNYSITYGNNTLTITQRPVTISGITAEDKEYDGNDVATLVLDGAQFANMVSGDTLSLDPAKVTGKFNNAIAWENKVVTITYATGALTGASAKNYVINSDSQKTTNATITKGTIKVKAKSTSVTYGDAATFEPIYSGMIEGETSSVVTGTPAYQISSDGDEWFDYATTTAVGTYYIRVNTEGLSATNYDIEWDADAEQKLTVKRRTISVTEKSSYTGPAKVYDGTTTVPASIALSDYYTINNVVNGDNVGLTFTKAYNSKDVATANKINISNLAITNTNYQLADTGNITKINATITQKALTVTIDTKQITYGSSAPTYTYSLNGLVSGESDNKTMTLTCSYDTSAAATRHVGAYDITPTTDYVDGNYNISYANNKKGTLTVNPKTLTVTAKDKTITYGDAPNNDGVSYSGFVYGEDETTALQGTLSYTYTYSQYDKAGSYKITPAGLSNKGSYDNYSISYGKGNLTVDKKDLTITGITSTDRDYDKTNKANLVVSGATYTGLVANDNGYKFDGAATGKMTVSGTYANKHAGTNKTVTLTITPGTYISERYNLKDCQTSTTSTVNKVNAKVTADNQTIQYGKPAPTYTYKESGFLTGETALTDYTGDKFTLSGTYVPEVTLVGTYTGAITFNVGTYVNKNYNITFEPGNIEVTNNKFATPSPSFSVGTVSWTAIPNVAGVSVKEYLVKLYKEGTETAVYNNPTTSTSINLESTIRTNGAGKYTVKVQAVTSDDTKVSSSDEGSATTYAATVTFVYATDAITAAGSQGCTATIAATSGTTGYLVIAGQQNVALSAGIKNATGYSLKNCSVTTGTGLTISDSAISESTYSGKVSAAQTMAITSGVITLSLNATPATAQIALTGDPASAYFGYPAKTGPDPTEDNPTPVVKIQDGYPKAADGDTYTGYSYTYQWQVKFGLTDSWHDVASAADGTVSADNRTYTFPLGKSVGTGYKIRCVIVATRADNGMTTPVVTADNAVGKNVTQGITIKRANFSSMTTITGWTYGEAPNSPSVTYNPGSAEVDYYYSTVSGTPISECTTVQPTEAGQYYVKAYIHESDDYAAYTTSDVAFTIAKGQLVMDSTSTAFEGVTAVGSWTAPPSIYEGGDSTKHEVKAASYDVALYKQNSDNTTWTKITGTEHNTTDLNYDFTDDILDSISAAGVYTYGVLAKSDDPDNVLDSAEVKYAGVTLLVTTVTDLTDSVEKTTKSYDKKALRIHVVLDGVTATSYDWYKDDVQITGATAQDYDANQVAQSGVYVAAVKNGADTVAYTIGKPITINKRNLEIRWNHPSRYTYIYNKNIHQVEPTFASGSIIEGDDVEQDVVDFRKTDAGTYTAVYSITGGADAGNYTYTNSTHEWTIEPKTVGIDWSDLTFTYDKTAHKPTATATGLCTKGDDTDVCTVTVTGEKTDAGTGYTATATALSNSNYKLPDDTTITTTTFAINPKEASLKWGTLQFTYNGENQKPTCSVDNLESGDTCTVTVTVPDDYSDVAEYTATAASLSNGNYKLPTNVTTKYNIVQRKLTVTWPATNTFTYSKQEKTYEATLSNIVAGDTVQATFQDSKKTLVGNYTAQITGITGADSANYYVADADKTHAWSIGQKEVVLNWANLSFTYDKTEHCPTATVSNKETGDDVNVTVTGGQTNAGVDYTATATELTGTDASQYKLPSVKTNKFTINKKEIGINWTNLEFTYDGQSHKPTATATGLESGDTVNITVNGEKTNAGVDYTATAASVDNSNYKLPAANTKPFTIKPRTISITWGNTSFTYNGQSQCPTATVGNLVTGDVCTINVTGGKTNTNYVDGSTNYTATASSLDGAAKGNYVLPTANTTTYTIARKDIAGATITLGAALTYTGSELTQTVSKVVIDGLEATFETSNNKQTHAGTYKDDKALVVTGTGNFTGTETKEFTIAQAANTWTTTPAIANWTYGSAASTPSYAAKFGTTAITYYGTANDGTAYAESATPPTKAGSYTAKFVVTETTNYTGLSTTVNFTINRKTVGINWTNTSLTYNGENQKPTATATGLVGTDSVSVTVTGEKKDSNVKTSTTNYTATADALTGADKDNYTLSDPKPTTTFTIAQKEVGISWGSTTFTYNGENQKPTATATGLVGTDSVSVTVAGEKKDSNVKTSTTNYTATADALTGTDKDNYKLPTTKPTTTFTIAQKEVGINWTNTALTYNGNAQKPTATATGLIGTDTATISVSGEKTDSNAKAGVASYTAMATSIDNGNYKLPTANTTPFLIGQKSIEGATVNLGPQLVYSGVEQTQTVTSVIIDGLNATYDVSDNKATNVGDYTLKVTGTGNFKDSTTKAFTVSLGTNEWTVEPAIANWTYGDTASNPVGTAKYGNDKLVIKYSGTLQDGTTYAETTTKPSKAGSYTATFTVPATTDYPVLTKAVNFTIYQREVTVTWGDTAFTYNGNAQKPTATAGNLVNSDTVTVTVGGEETYTNEYTGRSYTATATALSNANYKLPATAPTTGFAIGQKEVTLNWGDAAFTYNGQPQKPTATAGSLVGTDTCTVTVDGAKTDASDTAYTATATALSNANYKLPSVATKEFTIGKKTVSVTWPETLTFVYNGNTQGITPAIGDVVGTDDVSLVVSGNSAKNVSDSYKATVTGLTGTKSGNYKLPTTGLEKGWKITPKEVTLIWDYNDNLVYNGQPQCPGAIVSNVCPGDTCNVSKIEGAETDSNAKSGQAEYLAYATELDNSNYKLPSVAEIMYKIKQKEVGLTWTHTSDLEYNGTVQKPEATATGLCGSDVCTVTVTGEQTNAGTGYLATATKLSDLNYKLPSVKTTNFSIGKKAVTVQIGSATQKYDGTALTSNDFGAEGFIGSEGIESCDFKSAITDVGTMDNEYVEGTSVVIPKAGTILANYDITWNKGTLTVNKRYVTLTSGSAEAVYNGTALTKNEVQESVDGFVSGEGADYDVTGSQTNAGKSENTFDYAMNSGTKEGNYEITKKYGELKVTPAEITITADDQSSKRLEEEIKPLTGKITKGQLYGTDQISIGGTTEATKTSPSGDYDIVPTYTFINGTVADNYKVTLVNGKYTLIDVTRGKATLTLVLGEGVTVELVDKDAAIKACISDEDEQSLIDGKDIEYKLSIEYISDADVPQEDRTAIENQIQNSGIENLKNGRYMSIDILKKVAGGEWTIVTESKSEIAIALTIPSDITFEGATYYIGRVHNGQGATLQDTDKVENTITFSTGLFSTYAIEYAKKADPSPKTADRNNPWVWLLLLGLSSATIGVATYRRRRSAGR